MDACGFSRSRQTTENRVVDPVPFHAGPESIGEVLELGIAVIEDFRDIVKFEQFAVTEQCLVRHQVVGRHAEKLEKRVYESEERAVKVVRVRDLSLFTGRVKGPLQKGECKDAEENGPGYQDGKCGGSIARSGRAKTGVSFWDIHHPCADPDS